jgi:hypothetical protein
MVVKKWGPLIALLALFATGIAGLAIQYSEPHKQPLPAKAEAQNGPKSEAVTERATHPSDSKGEQEKSWYAPLLEKPTDMLLVIFNALLALFTWRLYIATNKLWLAGENQLAFMRKDSQSQAEDTKASLVIAEASAKAAQRAGEHFAVAERAWLFVPSADSEEASGTRENPFEGRRFYLVIVNTGHTPAVRADIYTDHALVDASAPVPTFMRVPDKEIWLTNIAPGARARSRPRYIGRSDIDALKRREKKLFLYVLLTYYTTFDPDAQRHTEVCFDAHFEGDMVNRDDGQQSPLFLFTATGPQNGFS